MSKVEGYQISVMPSLRLAPFIVNLSFNLLGYTGWNFGLKSMHVDKSELWVCGRTL
jgi:hypothetical protein